MATETTTSDSRSPLDPLVVQILEARKQQGYTQQNLADIAGISRRALAAIETGGDCTLSTLRSLCAALELDIQAHGASGKEMPTLDEVTEENRRERFGRERG